MIIETDLGHDCDDFFSICYLVAAGATIDAITVVPGDLDQLAICRLLCDEIGLKIPIGASGHNGRPGVAKMSSGGMHHELLKKYGRSFEATADAYGYEIIDKLADTNTEFFIIGPPTSIGKYLSVSSVMHPKLTMQGGFLGYHINPYNVPRIDKFEGKTWMPTFNMNGDRKGTQAILNAPIAERRFCGKNVCHTVLFDWDEYVALSKPTCRAAELFKEGMGLYLAKHGEKKFHDPVAAVCHLHPEIGYWVRGKVQKMEAGWGTVLDENGDYILGEINRPEFWQCIRNWR